MKIATHYTDIIISKIIITNCRNLKIRTHRECVATQPLAALRQAMACCSGVIQIRIFFASLGPLNGLRWCVGWLVCCCLLQEAWLGLAIFLFTPRCIISSSDADIYIYLWCVASVVEVVAEKWIKKQVVFETFPTTMELIIARARADDGFGWSIRGFPPPTTTTTPESRSRPGGLLPAAATNPA